MRQVSWQVSWRIDASDIPKFHLAAGMVLDGHQDIVLIHARLWPIRPTTGAQRQWQSPEWLVSSEIGLCRSIDSSKNEKPREACSYEQKVRRKWKPEIWVSHSCKWRHQIGREMSVKLILICAKVRSASIDSVFQHVDAWSHPPVYAS